MPRLLTRDQQHSYSRNGITFPVRVLSPAEVERFRAACDELEVRLGGAPRTIEVRQMHLHFCWAYELATSPRILDAVEDLLGPDLLIWATELFAKHPGQAAISIGWHRDRPYLGFDPRTTTTAWVALSESSERNGCLRAIPDPDRRTMPLDPERSIPIPLQPGEMSLHDADIWHGSAPNRSETKRVGFAIRFITPDAQPRCGKPPVVVARGRVPKGLFYVLPPPREHSAEAALAGMQHSAARHLEAMLANLENSGTKDER